jgi:hypothetical protein
LLAENQEFRDKLKIIIDNKEIKEDINVVLLKIINSGNTPIRKEDFADEINVVLEGELLQVDLDKELSIFDELSVKSLLLNKGDEFTIKILSTKNEKGIKVNSRIVGIKEIVKYKQPSFTVYHLIAFILTGIAIVTSFIFMGQDEKKWHTPFT